MLNEASNIPIVILAGGYGIYIDESGKRKSKANVLVEGKPLIYYVVLAYLQAGFRKFIVTGSYEIDVTKALVMESFNGTLKYKDEKFEVSYVDSGFHTKTGSRLKHALATIENFKYFGVTYSDSVSTQSLFDTLNFHLNSNLEATLTAVRLPSRFRIIGMRPGESIVRGFAEKPFFKGDYINGGFYFFKSTVTELPVWKKNENLVLETDLLDALTMKAQLASYIHEGAWHFLDCERDLGVLKDICLSLQNRES